MANSAYNETQEFLLAAVDEIKKRDEYKAEIDRLKSAYKKKSKEVSSEEKSIADEISHTVKKRKQEIESSYDKRIDDNRARKKRELNKRDKKKTERVNKRIESETKHIYSDTKDLHREIKGTMKRQNMPSICSKHLYYIMFVPKGMNELLLAFLSYIIYFAAIPTGLMLLIKKLTLEGKSHVGFWSTALLILFVVTQIIIYFKLYNSTKVEKREVVEEGRCIWDKINANKRQAKAIKNSINKDKDDSQYNLDAYDKKINELEDESDSITKEKKDALKEFDKKTAGAIEEEINNRRVPKLEEYKEEMYALENQISEAQAMYDDQAKLVANQYAAFLGEDICKYDKVSDLIVIMEDGRAQTVSEAIAVYKGGKR